MKKTLLLLTVFFMFMELNAQEKIWSKEKANEWYKKQGRLVGSDFLPSTAINQLEMLRLLTVSL